MANEFITVVIELPTDPSQRADLIRQLKFGNGEFMGGRVTAMSLGDSIAELEQLGH